MLIFREKFRDGFIRAVDIFWVTGERHPAEWSFAFAEERADIGWHKPREVESVLHAGVKSALADVVAIVEHLGAFLLESEHGLHVLGDGLCG